MTNERRGAYIGRAGRVRELMGRKLHLSEDEEVDCYLVRFDQAADFPAGFEHLCDGWHRFNKIDVAVDEAAGA